MGAVKKFDEWLHGGNALNAKGNFNWCASLVEWKLVFPIITKPCAKNFSLPFSDYNGGANFAAGQIRERNRQEHDLISEQFIEDVVVGVVPGFQQ